MKFITQKNNSKKYLWFGALTAEMILFTACAKKMQFQRSAIVPAAEGSVKYKKDKNGNFAVDIKVKHLAPAKRLSPPRNTYVVWMETESNGVQNIGRLKSSESFLTNTLNGGLKTTTTFKPVSFFITAENDAAVQYHSTPIVLDMKG